MAEEGEEYAELEAEDGDYVATGLGQCLVLIVVIVAERTMERQQIVTSSVSKA